MKTFLFPPFIIVLLMACENESVSPAISEANQRIELRSQGDQVNVCHNGNIIHPNINAVPDHQSHGDAVDLDDDGYFDLPNDCSSGVDCNDDDASINPGAEEECGDGIDNNCDGEIDENCIPSVTTCDQIWMLKNLDVATYRNGDPIPQVTDPAVWATLTTGAYCYYNNDSATYAATYGKLYNWYAINDPRGLAPVGWHVPTYGEWAALSTCYYGDIFSGGLLKESGTLHWNAPNSGATNYSGFTALPGGFRWSFGDFSLIGFNGAWWSSTEFNSEFVWVTGLSYAIGNFGQSPGNKRFGHSVRCVRD